VSSGPKGIGKEGGMNFPFIVNERKNLRKGGVTAMGDRKKRGGETKTGFKWKKAM